ncbi:MAG TPA: MFS transporter, partial [Chroococcales cyanobacterium]
MTGISIGGFGPVLGNSSFRALWFSQIFSQVADKIFFIILVKLVIGITPSNSAMSFALVAYTVPTVLFGAIAGALVDRLDKKRTMIVTNLLRGAAILLTTWTSNHYFVLVGVAFLVSTFSQPFTPAESSVIPLLVERESLLAANSLFATTIMASIIVGFTLGEPLIALTTLYWA